LFCLIIINHQSSTQKSSVWYKINLLLNWMQWKLFWFDHQHLNFNEKNNMEDFRRLIWPARAFAWLLFQAKNVEIVREPAHVYVCVGILLRDRLFHSRVRDGQRDRDGVVRHQAWSQWHLALRRALQNRLLLLGHGVRHDLHRRVPAATVRRPRQVKAAHTHIHAHHPPRFWMEFKKLNLNGSHLYTKLDF